MSSYELAPAEAKSVCELNDPDSTRCHCVITKDQANDVSIGERIRKLDRTPTEELTPTDRDLLEHIYKSYG